MAGITNFLYGIIPQSFYHNTSTQPTPEESEINVETFKSFQQQDLLKRAEKAFPKHQLKDALLLLRADSGFFWVLSNKSFRKYTWITTSLLMTSVCFTTAFKIYSMTKN